MQHPQEMDAWFFKTKCLAKNQSPATGRQTTTHEKGQHEDGEELTQRVGTDKTG